LISTLAAEVKAPSQVRRLADHVFERFEFDKICPPDITNHLSMDSAVPLGQVEQQEEDKHRALEQ
jgi:hypothetical protein